MPDCQLPEILFMALIGTFTMTLTILTLREAFLRSRGQ